MMMKKKEEEQFYNFLLQVQNYYINMATRMKNKAGKDKQTASHTRISIIEGTWFVTLSAFMFYNASINYWINYNNL